MRYGLSNAEWWTLAALRLQEKAGTARFDATEGFVILSLQLFDVALASPVLVHNLLISFDSINCWGGTDIHHMHVIFRESGLESGVTRTHKWMFLKTGIHSHM